MTTATPDRARDRARDRLKRAADVRRRAEAGLERARRELAQAIVDAARANLRQVDIVNITGYNREHIRRIVLKEAGITEEQPSPEADHN